MNLSISLVEKSMKIASMGPNSIVEKRETVEKSPPKPSFSGPRDPAESSGDSLVEEDAKGKASPARILSLIEEVQKRAKRKKSKLTSFRKRALQHFTRVARNENERDFKGNSLNLKV
jgi:hypothetical protein